MKTKTWLSQKVGMDYSEFLEKKKKKKNPLFKCIFQKYGLSE